MEYLEDKLKCADCRWYRKIDEITGVCRINPVSNYVDSAEMPCSKFKAKEESKPKSICGECALEGGTECLKFSASLMFFKPFADVRTCVKFKEMKCF